MSSDWTIRILLFLVNTIGSHTEIDAKSKNR